ncbi:glycosyltransferase family 4 protein [Luteolibacter algae]|uniref:Glycosyltransferase family 4 protein n=1 Tax=Luteolibacter algae TaxID=454151 RepID=A0ABW5D8V6_9BACT
MKILQTLPELNSGGVERGTLELADFLVKNGHEAIVVSNGGRQVEALERSGARHISMPVHRKSLVSLLQVRAFRRLLDREKPDILHIRSRVPGWIAWLAWRKMDPATRPRLVSTVHGFYSVNRYSAVMTKGEKIIAVSESIREYILKNYPETPSENIKVIHRGVSPEIFCRGYKPPEEWSQAWRSKFPQFETKKILLLPGRITRWKGQEDFIRLIASLRGEGVDAHGLIVGETHPRKQSFADELAMLCRTLEVSEHISFLGQRSDIRDIMAVSDVVFSLSRDPEAFGRVSLEAAAIGKPVIAYDHGGVREQLSDFFPEGLVDLGQPGELFKKTMEILATPMVPGLITNFTLNRMLESTVAVYTAIAKKDDERD